MANDGSMASIKFYIILSKYLKKKKKKKVQTKLNSNFIQYENGYSFKDLLNITFNNIIICSVKVTFKLKL